MQGLVTIGVAAILAAVSFAGAISGPARAGAHADITIEDGFMMLNLDFSRTRGVTLTITASHCADAGACQGLRILRRS
jgi:hypothetical protein